MTDGPLGLTCPFCRGVLQTSAQLERAVPHALQALTPEARLDALPFKKPRSCPRCQQVMAPLRIGAREAWLDHCAACDLWWVEAADAVSLKAVVSAAARQDAWASMAVDERAQLARDLADAEKPQTIAPMQEFSLAQAAQALVGVPVMASLEGAQRPLLTVASAAALLIAFLGSKVDPEAFGFGALAYLGRRDSVLGVFPAVLAHDGVGHLMGNLIFLFVFGDAVERKTPHLLVPATIFGLGALAIGVDALVSGPQTLVGGASGGVFGLMGLTLVLQRKGRWMLPLFGLVRRSVSALRVPLPVAMIVYAAWDVLRASATGSGIAWVAHAFGFALGVVIALVLERTRR